MVSSERLRRWLHSVKHAFRKKKTNVKDYNIPDNPLIPEVTGPFRLYFFLNWFGGHFLRDAGHMCWRQSNGRVGEPLTAVKDHTVLRDSAHFVMAHC